MNEKTIKIVVVIAICTIFTLSMNFITDFLGAGFANQEPSIERPITLKFITGSYLIWDSGNTRYVLNYSNNTAYLEMWGGINKILSPMSKVPLSIGTRVYMQGGEWTVTEITRGYTMFMLVVERWN